MDRIKEFLAKLADLSAVSDADLFTLEAEGLAIFDSLKAGEIEDLSQAEALDKGREIAAQVVAIQNEAAARIDAAMANAEEWDKLKAEIPAPDTPEGVEEAEQTDDAQEASEAEAGDGEPAPEEAPAPEGDDDGTVVVDATQTPEPVTAAAPAAPARPPLGAFAPRTVQSPQASPPPESHAEVAYLASGGEQVTTYARADQLMGECIRDIAPLGGRQAKTVVLRERYEYPEDRIIRTNDSGRAQTDKIEALVAGALDPESWLNPDGSMQAFTAAGQFCAPSEPFYGQPTVGDRGRPVRDMLPAMGLERGSIEVAAAPVLSDILVDQSGGAIDTLAPATTTGTKTIQEVVTCPDTVTTHLEATSVRLRFDNWNAMTWQERQQAWVRLTEIRADRHREQRLLAMIDALSTGPVTETFVVGAYRDVLVHLGRLVSAERHRQRMRPDARFRVIVDYGLLDAMKADLAMQMPGDGLEALRRAEDQIRADLSERGINLTTTWDRWIPAAQSAGAMTWWPAVWRFNVFPEGTFMFGGGQELNLGVIRDGDEVAGNTFQTFSEAFETAFRVGSWPAYTVDLNVCVNGTTSAAKDMSGECQGS